MLTLFYGTCLQKADPWNFYNCVFLAMLTGTLLMSGLLISTSSACMLISVQLHYNIQIIARFGMGFCFLGFFVSLVYVSLMSN